MASEKQIAANRANSKKSTGPKTYRGRARSAMNATTHGLTSKTIAMLHEDSIEFENRLMKSLAIRDVQDDNEEFLAWFKFGVFRVTVRTTNVPWRYKVLSVVR